MTPQIQGPLVARFSPRYKVVLVPTILRLSRWRGPPPERLKGVTPTLLENVTGSVKDRFGINWIKAFPFRICLITLSPVSLPMVAPIARWSILNRSVSLALEGTPLLVVHLLDLTPRRTQPRTRMHPGVQEQPLLITTPFSPLLFACLPIVRR